MIIGLLYGSFAAVFICVVLNAGDYTLATWSKCSIESYPNTDQLEYNSEPHFKIR